MKKVVCFMLAIIMMLSMTVTAFAAGNNNSENAPHIDPIFDLVDEISMVPQNGTLTTTTESIVVTGTISDADKIQELLILENTISIFLLDENGEVIIEDVN